MDLVYPNEKRLFIIAAILASVIWILFIFGTLGIALLCIAFFFLFAVFAQAGFITYVKGSGVRVTEKQFPDIHARLLACCKKVGQTDIPETYLLRTDFFNALATRFLRRHYIVLFTDVVDALEEQPGALNFYIGHELGHIHRNHIRWGWILSPALFLPILGSAYRRAEEYTCDRYGNHCCETDKDATAALAAIVAGDTRWKNMNVESYLEQVGSTGGFWMSLNELIAEYPWMSKRLAWIVAMRKNVKPDFPRRHPIAAILSAFVPSVPGGIASLMVTMAILGILAAVALPAYHEYKEAAQLAASSAQTSNFENVDYSPFLEKENLDNLLAELGTLREQIKLHHTKSNTFPTDFNEIGWNTTTLYSEHGGMPINLYNDGIIAVSFGDNGEAMQYLVNEPSVTEAGDFQWHCYAENIPTGALPEACQ